MYRQLYPYGRSDKFCNRIFTIFDENQDNKLDFNEFLRAIKITMNGDVKDKLRCAFAIYDLNGDGKIDKKEMKKVLNHIYDMLGEDTLKYRRHGRVTDKKVDLIFDKFDLDRDNCLSLDEFIDGCLKDEYLSQLLRTSFNLNSNTTTTSTTTAAAPVAAESLNESAASKVESTTTTTTTTNKSDLLRKKLTTATSILNVNARRRTSLLITAISCDELNTTPTEATTTATNSSANIQSSMDYDDDDNDEIQQTADNNKNKIFNTGLAVVDRRRVYSRSNQNLSTTLPSLTIIKQSSNKLNGSNNNNNIDNENQDEFSKFSSSYLNISANNFYTDSGYNQSKQLNVNRLKNIKELSNFKRINNNNNNSNLLNKNSFGGSNSTNSPLSSTNTSNSNLNMSLGKLNDYSSFLTNNFNRR